MCSEKYYSTSFCAPTDDRLIIVWSGREHLSSRNICDDSSSTNDSSSARDIYLARDRSSLSHKLICHMHKEAEKVPAVIIRPRATTICQVALLPFLNKVSGFSGALMIAIPIFCDSRYATTTTTVLLLLLLQLLLYSRLSFVLRHN